MALYKHEVFQLISHIGYMICQLEKAYDKIMMSQLTSRKKGLTFGQFQVKLLTLLLLTYIFGQSYSQQA